LSRLYAIATYFRHARHDLLTTKRLKELRNSPALMAVVIADVKREFRGIDQRPEANATHTTSCSGF
jgi:hypothetical protein